MPPLFVECGRALSVAHVRLSVRLSIQFVVCKWYPVHLLYTQCLIAGEIKTIGGGIRVPWTLFLVIFCYTLQGCATSPNDSERQQMLRSAAEELRSATNTAASNALKKKLIKRLEVCNFNYQYLHMGLNVSKNCLRGFVNNKGADPPAHPCKLISTFVISFLKSIICKHATGEISIF